jgi:hypothetical protein
MRRVGRVRHAEELGQPIATHRGPADHGGCQQDDLGATDHAPMALSHRNPGERIRAVHGTRQAIHLLANTVIDP